MVIELFVKFLTQRLGKFSIDQILDTEEYTDVVNEYQGFFIFSPIFDDF